MWVMDQVLDHAQRKETMNLKKEEGRRKKEEK